MATTKIERLWKPILLYIGLVVLLLAVGVFMGIFIRNKQMFNDETLNKARSDFLNIVLTRRWNAHYGGVYIEKKAGMESNQFLKNPDIKSVDGKIYTKKNPALMTREISELAEMEGKFTFHITSTRPLNPVNIPDEFEYAALKRFEKGEKEVYAKVLENGETFFRYIAPLYTEESCLDCHAEQGYKVGSVRGGISVKFDITEVEKSLTRSTTLIFILTGITVLILLGLIYFFIMRLMKRVSELDDLKNKFLGMAAHDLRSPLTAIQGYCDMLLEEDDDIDEEERIEFLTIINDTSNNMLNLVNELLDVTSIESGKFDVYVEPGPLAQLLEERITICQTMAPKKNIRIHTAFEEISEALFDKKRISQVVDNLISNAIKFSAADTDIHILLEQEGEMAKVSVRDQGPGVSEEDRIKLFGEFQKLSARPTGGEASTGLGLSIVKKILDAHNGNIWVDSKPGEGAAFIFTLPISI